MFIAFLLAKWTNLLVIWLSHCGLSQCRVSTGATVAGLTAVGSGFGTTARADRRRDVGIPSTIQIILYMWDDHVSFGNKNPASGYKLQIFDKGQIMKGSSGNITAVNLHGIEDATGAISPKSGRCPFNFTQESFVGIILKLIGEAVLIVVSGFSAAFGRS